MHVLRVRAPWARVPAALPPLGREGQGAGAGTRARSHHRDSERSTNLRRKLSYKSSLSPSGKIQFRERAFFTWQGHGNRCVSYILASAPPHGQRYLSRLLEPRPGGGVTALSHQPTPVAPHPSGGFQFDFNSGLCSSQQALAPCRAAPPRCCTSASNPSPRSVSI